MDSFIFCIGGRVFRTEAMNISRPPLTENSLVAWWFRYGERTPPTQPPLLSYLYINLNRSHTNGISSENSLLILGRTREKKFRCACRQYSSDRSPSPSARAKSASTSLYLRRVTSMVSVMQTGFPYPSSSTQMSPTWVRGLPSTSHSHKLPQDAVFFSIKTSWSNP